MLAVCAGYLAWQGPGVVVDWAQKVLRENGLPEVDFELRDLSLETVTLEGIRIGREGALKIPRISAVFTWRELIDGEVGEIAVDDLELTVIQRDQGLSFGELDPFVYGATEETDEEIAIGSLNWPFRKLTLGNARVVLVKDAGTIAAITINGTVQRNPSGGLDIGPGRISVASPELSLTADVEATVSGDGKLTAGMQLANGRAAVQGYEVTAQDGNLSLETPLDDLSALQAVGDLRVSKVSLPFGLATSGNMTVSIRQNRMTASLLAADEKHGLKASLDIAASLAEPLAAQPIAIDVSLSASDAALFPSGLLPVPLTHGAARLHVSLDDRVGNLQSLAGVDGLLALAKGFPSLAIELEGSEIESPALPGRADMKAAISLERTGDGRIAVQVPKGIQASLSPIDAEDWLTMLGPLGQPGPVTPLLVSISQTDATPLLILDPGQILQKSRFDGAVRLEGGALPALDTALSASVILDPRAGIFDLTADALSLSMDSAVIDDVTLTDVTLDATASATESGGSGLADLTAALSGGNRDTLYIPSGKVSIPLSWQIAPDRLTLRIRDCAEFLVPKLLSGDFQIDMRTMRLCLREDGGDFLTITTGPAGDLATASMNARLSMLGRDIVMTGKDGWRARLNGKNNEAVLHAHLSPDGTVGVTSDISLGAVTLPSSLLRIDEFRLAAAGENAGKELGVTLAATVSDLRKPRLFAPLELTVKSTASKQDRLVASGKVIPRNTPLILEWDAEHRLSTRKGDATFRLHPFVFGLGVNKFSDVTSILQGVVSRPAGQLLGAASASWEGGEGCGNADLLIRRGSAVLPGSGPIPLQGEVSFGQLGLTGKVCAGSDGIQSQIGQLLLDGMEFAGEQVSARAVNANIDVASFYPFATAPDQALSVGVLDLGFPLTDGIALFDISDTSRFNLEKLSFNWAGGTVSIAPFQIAPDTPLESLDLSVKGARLEKLTELVPDKGITGEGILDGTLPIHFTVEGPAVRQGYLETRGPGILRYKRSLEEGEEPTAVDDVLSNLQYSNLRIDIDGGLSGGVGIGLHVEGANPDYLDGYPVVLDVNVNGPLGAIMNDGLATYQVPSQILERMRRFGQIE
ncbi:intermembrane phospholipid transport protein YdbH family protein [Hwanghaeella grinnelliae]|uniref:intermembrane phospholipid transport protein YdbH family protein n=1 Tax=Hwanghaeella grinnelliae TaxID=2500179 RepID=UPI001EFF8E89|nr:YdbH domain-containing protein [Hwanghaeella grinnelliae]